MSRKKLTLKAPWFGKQYNEWMRIVGAMDADITDYKAQRGEEYLRREDISHQILMARIDLSDMTSDPKDGDNRLPSEYGHLAVEYQQMEMIKAYLEARQRIIEHEIQVAIVNADQKLFEECGN